MAQATFTKLAAMQIESSNTIEINTETNVWTRKYRLFNGDFISVPMHRGAYLATLEPGQKNFVQTLLDTYTRDSLNQLTGMALILNEIRASDLAYKVDAPAPVQGE